MTLLHGGTGRGIPDRPDGAITRMKRSDGKFSGLFSEPEKKPDMLEDTSRLIADMLSPVGRCRLTVSKAVFTALWFQRLKLYYHNLLSTFAFMLCRVTVSKAVLKAHVVSAL